MNQTPYYADGTELILQFMRDAFGKQYHAYFEGDPYDIPQSLLPCIIVTKESGTSNPGPTGTQDITEVILVQVVRNKKDDFGAAKDYPNVDMTNRTLRQVVEGRDQTTARYLPDTICGILSSNITLGDNVLQMNIAISYPLTARMEGMLTQEAHITVTLRERVIILNRGE